MEQVGPGFECEGQAWWEVYSRYPNVYPGNSSGGAVYVASIYQPGDTIYAEVWAYGSALAKWGFYGTDTTHPTMGTLSTTFTLNGYVCTCNASEFIIENNAHTQLGDFGTIDFNSDYVTIVGGNGYYYPAGSFYYNGYYMTTDGSPSGGLLATTHGWLDPPTDSSFPISRTLLNR
jgi:hypothetical protein